MEYYDIDFSELTVEEFAVLHITESMIVQGYDTVSYTHLRAHET